MILIKDRHLSDISLINSIFFMIGKYDTYKGSTLIDSIDNIFTSSWGNMILIKDRHSSGYIKPAPSGFGEI